jgi:hypothetical protein
MTTGTSGFTNFIPLLFHFRLLVNHFIRKGVSHPLAKVSLILIPHPKVSLMPPKGLSPSLLILIPQKKHEGGHRSLIPHPQRSLSFSSLTQRSLSFSSHKKNTKEVTEVSLLARKGLSQRSQKSLSFSSLPKVSLSKVSLIPQKLKGSLYCFFSETRNAST